ncbi:hypothetical protein NPIL_704211 [Nephila pilipes]|uniref:Uncharacterized protein n=1 Tax=Nephila pilipes TaxID=299642 RepID=A0A8X6TSY6_NEPPI|nr:hypothetical protein NPIL_704211 [Nephila pilipes]
MQRLSSTTTLEVKTPYLISQKRCLFSLVVNLEARRNRENGRERQTKDVESGSGRRKDSSRKKQPFPMFESCRDFNEEYVQKMKELKRSREIGRKNCQDEDRKMCMQKAMETIRCSGIQEPSEACKTEINNFLDGVKCGNNEGETEDESDNDSKDEPDEDDSDDTGGINGDKDEDGGLDEGKDQTTSLKP